MPVVICLVLKVDQWKLNSWFYTRNKLSWLNCWIMLQFFHFIQIPNNIVIVIDDELLILMSLNSNDGVAGSSEFWTFVVMKADNRFNLLLIVVCFILFGIYLHHEQPNQNRCFSRNCAVWLLKTDRVVDYSSKTLEFHKHTETVVEVSFWSESISQFRSKIYNGNQSSSELKMRNWIQ